MNVRDLDLAAFSRYANRELTLDRASKTAEKYGTSVQHRQSLAVLRSVNLKTLYSETRRGRVLLDPDGFMWR